MSLKIEKKKIGNDAPKANDGLKSKGVNRVLWLLVVLCVVIAAVINTYFVTQIPFIARVIGVIALLVLAFVFAALTNQGIKARNFMKESRIELRKVIWPTRQEATQTTLIVMGVTVLVSLILWGLDSIIIAILSFLTNLRF